MADINSTFSITLSSIAQSATRTEKEIETLETINEMLRNTLRNKM
nr:hypothetical protein [Staphylococcus sp. NRL 21/187]